MIHASKWALAATLVLAMGAEAKQPSALSYNRIEAAVTRADAEDFDEDATGYALSGSFEFGSNFHLWASFESAGVEQSYTLEIAPPIHNDVEVDARAFAIGGGVQRALSDRASVYGRIGAVQWSGEASSFGHDFDYDSTGYTVGGGLRFQAAPRAELRVGAAMFDDGDGESTTMGTAGVEVSVADNIGVSGGVSVDDEGTGWGVGVAFRF